MMSFDVANYQLPAKIYRRLLLLTEMWPGERAALGSLLIKFHNGGTKTPFFWAGESSFLASFQEILGVDRSIYCMSGLSGTLPPTEENICAIGRYYAREILNVQPQGPYLLGGWCDASFISYEVAKVLQVLGHEVSMLILLDRDVSEQETSLKIARRLYRAVEQIDKRRKQMLENPIVCIKELLIGKRNDALAIINSLGRKLGVKTSASATIPHYYLTDYAGNVQLIIVKWGLLGFYRFAYFRRYWQKRVTGQLTFHLIDGKKHAHPDWPTIAHIINNCFKQAGI